MFVTVAYGSMDWVDLVSNGWIMVLVRDGRALMMKIE